MERKSIVEKIWEGNNYTSTSSEVQFADGSNTRPTTVSKNKRTLGPLCAATDFG
jgi:hypothetical protein